MLWLDEPPMSAYRIFRITFRIIAKMAFLDRIFGKAAADPRETMRALYSQIVAKARVPHWYVDGGVPDSVDGRFDMVATVLTVVLLRLEPDYAQQSVFLTEIFVDDMDAQLREFGIGDIIVGKHVGKMMGALGGRLGSLREALADGGDLDGFVLRNLHRGEDLPDRAHVALQLRALTEQLETLDNDALLNGNAVW
jgi:cytochrome b pre-mRNA-processing protein 3